MELLNKLVLQVNDFIWTYILIAMLIILGIYFTVKTNFVQFRFFKEMFKLLGDGASKDAKKEGKISSFQAFCISTASRVGTGNIAGIAIAVVAGGPGAIFWMWLIALIGSASGFVESTLAQIYKVKDGNAYRGGPAYYMEQGLNKKWMGIIFSVLITICFAFVFNAVQANTITAAFNNAFGINRFGLGLVIAAVTAVVIFGGSHRIAKVSEVIVPVLAVIYILVSLFVVVINITELPNVIKLIFTNALDFRSMSMGTMGGIILVGVKRGLFSNEAGMGSAPNAAATAEVSHPVKQGLIQALGVFVDTLIICSCTAFVVLLYPGYATSSAEGIGLTQEALTYHIGPIGNIFIALCILLSEAASEERRCAHPLRRQRAPHPRSGRGEDVHHGRGGDGASPHGAVQQADVRRAEPPHRAMGLGMDAPLPGGEPARGDEARLRKAEPQAVLRAHRVGRLGRRDHRAHAVREDTGLGGSPAGVHRGADSRDSRRDLRPQGAEGRALRRKADGGDQEAAGGQARQAGRPVGQGRRAHLRGAGRRPDLRRRGPLLQEPFLPHQDAQRRRHRPERGQEVLRPVHEVPHPRPADRRARHRVRHGHPGVELHGGALHDAALPPVRRAGTAGAVPLRLLGLDVRRDGDGAGAGSGRHRLPPEDAVLALLQPARAHGLSLIHIWKKSHRTELEPRKRLAEPLPRFPEEK